MKTNAKQQFLRGMRAGIPVILGFVPVGIAYAIMARQAGFSNVQTCLMSLSVFAGASQMMATGMYAQGASIFAMILATFILNLRHLIMSTCVTEVSGSVCWLPLVSQTNPSRSLQQKKKKTAQSCFFWD